MSRALRRHHEKRIKHKFVKVVKNQTTQATESLQRLAARRGISYEKLVKDWAARRAHHPTCPCGACKKEKYDRNEEKRRKLEEE